MQIIMQIFNDVYKVISSSLGKRVHIAGYNELIAEKTSKIDSLKAKNPEPSADATHEIEKNGRAIKHLRREMHNLQEKVHESLNNVEDISTLMNTISFIARKKYFYFILFKLIITLFSVELSVNPIDAIYIMSLMSFLVCSPPE